MNYYDGIYNCSGLKYGTTYKIFDTFLLISFDGTYQNIGKKTYNKN
jgi:hypothetical protein